VPRALLAAAQPAGLMYDPRPAPGGDHCTGVTLAVGGRCTIDLEIMVGQVQGPKGRLQPYSGRFTVQIDLGQSSITLTGTEL
jgi:hypothetical protein